MLNINSLHKEHNEDLLGYLVSCGIPQSDKEDVSQMVWMRVWVYADRFNETRAFKPWLFGLARHSVGDYNRHESREKRKYVLNPILDADPDSTIWEHADTVGWMKRCAEIDEDGILLRLSIEKALLRMTDVQRSRLIRIYFFRMPYSDVARQDRTVKGTIARSVHRAKKNFARIWEDIE